MWWFIGSHQLCNSLLDFCDCNSFHTDSWNKLEWKHPYSHINGKGQTEINSRYIIAHDNQIHILHDPKIWQMSCRLQVPYYKLPEDKDLDTCWSKLCSHCILQRRTILGGAKMNDASWTHSYTELSLGCLLKIDGPTPWKHLWYPCSWTALST
jgi:hypothetical protein